MSDGNGVGAGRPPVATGSRGRRMLAALLVVAGLWTVSPLLAWVYGLGSFAAWFWLGLSPAVALMVAAVLWLRHRDPAGEMLTAMSAGVLGGVLATVAYDLVRVPIVVWTGYRLFAPVSSYGLLITDRAPRASSPSSSAGGTTSSTASDSRSPSRCSASGADGRGRSPSRCCSRP